MIDIRKGMKSISGNEPTKEQIARITGIAHDFDIPKNDAMFPIMVMMDQYHGVFSELPEKMRTVADEVANAVASDTKDKVTNAVVDAIRKMGPKIDAALHDHAKALNQVDRAKWIGGVVLLVALVFTVFGWITYTVGYSSGFETGNTDGHKAAENEKAMAAWANTNQGRLAYELAMAGSLEMLANCNGSGWKLEEGVCTPYSHKEGEKTMLTTWFVGKSAGGAPARKINVL